MSAAKKLERMPEELFLEEAMRGGRCVKTRISMKAIGKPDTKYQARVEHLDLGHVSRLEAMLIPGDDGKPGDTFPLVVFCDRKASRFILADGFHRHEAYRRARRDSVPAYQVTSDDPEREALEYCTMCNRLALKTRTKEDAKKAIEMLLANDTWKYRSDSWIGDHVGCDRTTVRRIRAILIANGQDRPEYIEAKSGELFRYGSAERLPREAVPRPYKRHGHSSGFRVYQKGRCFTGRTPNDVLARIANVEVREHLRLDSDKKDNENRQLDRQAFYNFASKMGFTSVFGRTMSHLYKHISCYHRPGMVCATTNFADRSFAMATHSLMLGRQKASDSDARMIVVCYIQDGPSRLIELARQAGFEFMTPDELIAAIGDASAPSEDPDS